MDEWLAPIRDSVVPLREQNGFLGFVALADRERDESIGYSMQAGEEDLAVRDADEVTVVAQP